MLAKHRRLDNSRTHVLNSYEDNLANESSDDDCDIDTVSNTAVLGEDCDIDDVSSVADDDLAVDSIAEWMINGW